MNFERRDAQTRVKHEILRSYAGSWSGIISRGLRRRGGRYTVDFVYVDGYGGAGRFMRDADCETLETPIWGSPIIGARTILETLLHAPAGEPEFRFSAFIVEQDPEHYRRLIDNLVAAQLPVNVREKTSFGRNDLGTVAVLCGDFRKHVSAIENAVGQSAYMLGFIDPFGPSMPMSSLRSLIARPRTDVITLFPVEDVDRKAASVLKPIDEREPGDRGNINRVKVHFGSDDWIPIARDRDADSATRRDRYADIYARQLRGIDPEVVVKNIPLRFAAIDRIVHHFFLTTRDADGAFRMNEILRKAEISQHYAIWADAVQRQRDRERASSQATLFDLLDVPIATAPPAEIKRADPDEVTSVIQAKCPRGVTMSFKEFVKYVADTPYTRAEVEGALKRLQREQQVEFDGLSSTSRILLK